MKLRKGISRIERDHGWNARHYHEGEEHPTFFADSKYGNDPNKSYAAACSHLDFLDELFPPTHRPFKITPHKSKKDKLPVGVYHSHSPLRSGNVEWRYQASWVDQATGEKRVKTFVYDPANPEERDEARAAAIRCRRKHVAEMKAAGLDAGAATQPSIEG